MLRKDAHQELGWALGEVVIPKSGWGKGSCEDRPLAAKATGT